MSYRIDRPHDPSEDVSIAFDDPELAIPWPLPVTVGILNYMGYDQIQYARMAAASVICITPEIAVGIFIQRYIIKGLSSGSIKG